ncbi:hypothetical protein NIM87_17035 [Devosia sp. XJ19-1]|uniref:Uncharacterized protein n=1 Tax=Devosia ureilytica TaxID=2952754 RepID=A0A9Q4ARR2_9HYPH|nr:hypothetical protein [Devosia ureilytica]MCP8885217.1 hypothetical protein [Devosia ureilytica]MCP8888675.1 hypothetical protein [Devosia ureilytica]
MVFDSLKQRAGGDDQLNPMQIAHHTLFTAREKLELLHQLKAETTGDEVEGAEVAFEPEEIDQAIAEVRRGVESGVGADTVLKGDF